MLAVEPDVGPPAKSRGISTMSSLVGREIMPNDEASATRKIPGGLRFVGVMEEVGSSCRGRCSESIGKEVRGRKGPLMQTMFSEESNASIALGKGLGVKDGFRGILRLRLWTNILEGNNGAVVSWARRHGVTKSFTIRHIHRDTK